MIIALSLTLALLAGCDRRTEVPTARTQADCEPLEIGAAEEISTRTDLPFDRVVTLEGMPHPTFFGWVQDGRQRAVSKLLGTERRVLLVQEFQGEAPPTSTKITGLLRRWSDLPANPWDAVKTGIKTRFTWDVPAEAFVILEGVRPRGCE